VGTCGTLTHKLDDAMVGRQDLMVILTGADGRSFMPVPPFRHHR
jgi:hypothetical protein